MSHRCAGLDWFGPEVTEPVRLPVDAKRHLCAVEPDYLRQLSRASVYTLGVQGGPMYGDELDSFQANPFSAAACQVRRWDDRAEDPDAVAPPFAQFAPVLEGLLR